MQTTAEPLQLLQRLAQVAVRGVDSASYCVCWRPNAGVADVLCVSGEKSKANGLAHASIECCPAVDWKASVLAVLAFACLQQLALTSATRIIRPCHRCLLCAY